MPDSSKTFGKLTIPLLLLLAICFWALPAQAKYGGGTGEPNNPYLISTAEDMNAIGADSNDWDKHFKMTADINMAGYTYTTALIASDTDNTNWDFDGTPFAGTFDGGNFKIAALTITTGDENNYLGLFGSVNVDSNITNLVLENVNIISGGYSHSLGSLCGQNRGTISNCYITGSVNGSYYLGGLCGYNDGGTIIKCNVTGFVTGEGDIGGLCGVNVYGAISNCHVSGSVTSVGYYSGDIGGLCGWNSHGIIINCKTTGSVIGSGYGLGWLGGLCGENYKGTISNCTASSPVTGGDGSFDIGGLCGRNNDGTINSCAANGSVNGGENSDCIGGLCGYNFGEISNCYATNSVTSPNDSYYLGGLVGYNISTITNCYAAGSVTGGIGSSHLGGLAGYNWGGTITNCYSVGSVDGNSEVGGLLGHHHSGSYSKCFWDSEVNPDVNGIGNTTDPNVIGESTVNMQTESTFTDAGWDFNTPIWKFCSLPDYPKLAWQECPGAEAPVLHSEPNMTIGTSNTIFWDAVAEANDYIAERANDANFTGIVDSSGWIADTNCTFYDLEAGQTYWYRVKARNAVGTETGWSNVESSLQVTLADAVDAMLDPDTLKNKNMKNALLNKINAVQQMLDKGRYEEALNKLQNDILKKTNGCAETGRPDKNDWIITCEEQEQIYPLIIETIENVKGLMNQ